MIHLTLEQADLCRFPSLGDYQYTHQGILYLLHLLYVHYIQCLMDIVINLLYILLNLFYLGSGAACLQQTIYSFETDLCLVGYRNHLHFCQKL
jgi:hypothetical protein